MYKNAKKRVIAISALTLLAVAMVSVGVVLAILSKNVESRANNFSFSSVEIELTEPKWNEDPSEKVVYPGAVVKKDPTVTNTGENDLYVYLEVCIPKGTVRTVATDEKMLQDAAEIDLLSFEPHPDWILLFDSNKDHDYDKEGYRVCIYAYQKVLSPEEATVPLFEEVTYSEWILESQHGIPETFDMPITAYAVQAEYLNQSIDPEVALANAFDIYRKQTERNQSRS